MAKHQHTIQLSFFADGTISAPAKRRKHYGRPLSEAHKRNIGAKAKGRKLHLSATQTQKLRERMLGRFIGEKSPSWKGGPAEVICKTCAKPFPVKRYRLGQVKYCSRQCFKNDPDKKSAEHKRIRASNEYRTWREAVFSRDDYTCQMCGKRGGITLQADHIKPFALFPALRFDVDNGRTLCIDCHSKTETFGVMTWRRKKYLLGLEAEAPPLESDKPLQLSLFS